VNTATLQNLTAMAFTMASDDPEGPEHWKLQVLLGSKRSHVDFASLSANDLYGKIRDVLEYKCKKNSYGRDTCEQDEYTWGPVQYNSINSCGAWKRGFCRNDARHVIQVYSNNFPSSMPGLREVFISHVADVFRATVLDGKNQYSLHLHDGSKTKICGFQDFDWYSFANAPNKVEISLSPPPYEDLEQYPHLFVRFNLNKDAVEGKWDCIGSISPVDKVAPPERVETYSHLIGKPVWGWTDCPSKEIDGDCSDPGNGAVKIKDCTY
jgi:hypothetical protein